ncbi:MAG TPA: protein kinase [Polyangiales bacterium]|nr:protein kinase [Polyangiales bacterium]
MLGAFKLLNEVARGELASIWRARPLEDDSPLVALKRLHKPHLRNPEYRAAIEREAELMAGFTGQGFLASARFERAPEPYTVMEYVEGQDLASLLDNARRHDAESTRFAVPLLVDALHALEALHRSPAALVHQAPVARHVLAGVDGRARLIDFTLVMGASTTRPPLCDHRLLPMEMAPEQVLAPSMIDARADIFILGLTLWETLTGQRLFDGKNPLESQRRMLSGPIGSPSDASRGVHRVFDRICRRALSRPRGERYASAQEMAGELRDEAMRVGAWAEPEEVGTWVRTTIALGRTAPRTVPRDYARSEAAQTMMGIGAPNAEVLSIADSYRQSQPGAPRSGRHLRSTGSQPPPERRDSTVPFTEEGAEATSLITRGKRPSHVPEPAVREPAQQIQVPDLSRLGGAPDFEDAGYAVRKGGPSFAMIVLAVLGVGLVGFGAYVVRERQGGPSKPQTFSAAPAQDAPTEAAAWPAPLAPAIAQPEVVQPEPAPADLPPSASGGNAKEVIAKEAAAKEAVAKDVIAKEAVAKESAAKAASAAKPAKEEPKPVVDSSKRRAKAEPRWDVSPALAGDEPADKPAQDVSDKPSWSNAAPTWNSPAPAPAKERETPGSAPADLPINPY